MITSKLNNTVCEACHQLVGKVIRFRDYLEEPIWLCQDCYRDAMDSKPERSKP